MDALPTIPLLYVVTVSLLGLYGLHRLSMVVRFRWPVRQGLSSEDEGDPIGATAQDPACEPPAFLPHVTVQLPLYNERTVAARLLRAVGELDYPRDALEIQVLEDSTDETKEIVAQEARRLRRRGCDVQVVRRSDRHGYKAGALDYGLRGAKGELLCVFDADFTPRPDFLRRLVPHFQDPDVGLVQARWEHRNRDDSMLTRAQSTLLDGHFVIEHKVRADGGLFFNFNGTAGIWRRAAIESAGGWQHDTLTEDLDLSYRAQLAGWRFVYAPLVCAPAEVPPDITAFKSQQQRWAKGSVQVARKLGWRILRSRVPWRIKLEAAAHLTGNVGYPLVLFLAVLLPLAVAQRESVSSAWYVAMFVLCAMSPALFYERSQRALGRGGIARLRDVPSAISLGIGMCVSQTQAVLEGLLLRTGEFVRTPKRGDAPLRARYHGRLRGLPGIELALAGWFAWAIAMAAVRNRWGALPFLLLFFSGFAWVGTLSLQDWLRTRRVRS